VWWTVVHGREDGDRSYSQFVGGSLSSCLFIGRSGGPGHRMILGRMMILFRSSVVGIRVVVGGHTDPPVGHTDPGKRTFVGNIGVEGPWLENI